MPSSAIAKIKWVPNRILWVGLSLAVVAAGLGLFLLLRPRQPMVYASHAAYRTEIVRTAQAQARGLGGRNNMPQDNGMLFVFSVPKEQCFWMKDMQFPLDIIWLDAQKRVVRIERNLAPDTYPQAYCAQNTQYVLELNAGQAVRAGVRVGSTLRF